MGFDAASGNLQRVINALDSYECDEISIILPQRGDMSLSSMGSDLEVLRNMNSSSPMSIGGGIRSFSDLEYLSYLPVERFMLSTAMIAKNWKLVEKLRQNFGAQAIQCVLPIKNVSDNIFIYNSMEQKFIPVEELDIELIKEVSNEVIVYDTRADGLYDAFNFESLSRLNLNMNKTIITGGIGERTIKSAVDIGLAACLVDNRVLHREYSINELKRKNRLF